jgi:hypothetical protein
MAKRTNLIILFALLYLLPNRGVSQTLIARNWNSSISESELARSYNKLILDNLTALDENKRVFYTVEIVLVDNTGMNYKADQIDLETIRTNIASANNIFVIIRTRNRGVVAEIMSIPSREIKTIKIFTNSGSGNSGY